MLCSQGMHRLVLPMQYWCQLTEHMLMTLLFAWGVLLAHRSRCTARMQLPPAGVMPVPLSLADAHWHLAGFMSSAPMAASVYPLPNT